MAKKMNPQAKPKMQAPLKEEAARFLAEVPPEYVFWCHDSRIFRGMQDLTEGLAAMSDETFACHVNSEKNDFSKWVKEVINDERLANDLAEAKNREQAAGYVNARLAFLARQAK